MMCRFSSLVASLVLGIAVIWVPAGSLVAQPAAETDVPTLPPYLRSHQLGVRLGGWANQGALPPDSTDIGGGGYYTIDVRDASFYLEGFLGYRLNRNLLLEFSLGMVSRGDVTLVEPNNGGSSIGTVQLYPIHAKLVCYPFAKANWTIFPYVFAGGGFVYGRHDIQFFTGLDAYLRAEFGGDSETDFNYVLGGGVDWPVADMIALELSSQYMPVHFSGNLVGARDFSAVTITIGVKYLMTSLNGKKHPYRPLSRRSE